MAPLWLSREPHSLCTIRKRELCPSWTVAVSVPAQMIFQIILSHLTDSIFLFLFIQKKKKAEKHSQRGLPYAGPLHKCPQQPGLGWVKARSQKLSLRLLGGWRGPNYVGLGCCFSGASLVGSWGQQPGPGIEPISWHPHHWAACLPSVGFLPPTERSMLPFQMLLTGFPYLSPATFLPLF